MSETLASMVQVAPYVGGIFGPRDYIPEFYEASWKGVPFFCEKSDDTFGRRGDIYEYPLGEDVGYKDLGRKVRRFRLNGYVIGGSGAGSGQVDLTTQLIQAAESPEPGELVHPLLGTLLCACITLKTQIEYYKEKRCTKLEWEFVEAEQAMAPYTLGTDINWLFDIHWAVIYAIVRQATWEPQPQEQQEAARVANSLAHYLAPASDEASFDAIDRLTRTWEAYQTFEYVAAPIIDGTATIRRIHTDAVQRLESWNSSITAATGTGIGVSTAGVAGAGLAELSPSIESLILIARMALVRDLALAVAQTTYKTVHDAIADLDFLIRLYDEEEAIAVHRCADELTITIRQARATAVRTILNANIRLPGIVETDVHGVWPSLVAAHILYGDGTRHLEVENYNLNQNPFFMGSRIIAPAA